MFATLLVALAAFTLLLAVLVLARYRLAELEDEVEALWLRPPLRREPAGAGAAPVF
jgi:hypothetical protein